jgi:O-antigen/teichoic acid export membrane protein
MIVCIILNISIAGYLASLWHYPGLVPMFYLYSIVYLFQGILSQFQWIEQANLSFRGTLITSVIKQGGFFFYVLACFIFHWKASLLDLIYVQAISSFMGMVAEYFFVKKYLSFSLKTNMAWVKKLINFGKYVFGTSLSGVLSGTISQMMLGAILSPDAAGAFNVSTKLINLIDLPTNSMGAVVFPQSAKRFATEGNSAVKYLYEKSVGTILALSIPLLLFLFLFPGFVVHIIAGNKYAETVPILRVMILCSLVNPFMRLFGPILDSIGKPNINFVIVILFTVVNLALNYILIGRLGIMGSVYATLIADIIVCAIMYIILRREFRVNPFSTFRYAIEFYPEFVKNYLKQIIKYK